jgi:hypothetical protein
MLAFDLLKKGLTWWAFVSFVFSDLRVIRSGILVSLRVLLLLSLGPSWIQCLILTHFCDSASLGHGIECRRPGVPIGD